MTNKTYRLAEKLLASLAMFSFLWFTACNKNDDPKPPVEIQFTNEMKVVGEAAGPQTISLTLSKAASKNGSVKLTASPAHASTWANFPSTLEITEGNTAVQFTLTPVNNAVLDDARAITFTLSEPTSGFKLGAQTTMTVNITDDEAPAQANFSVNSTSTAEDNDEGVEVVLNISAPAPGTGNLTVNFSSDNAVYTTHFTTVPAATGNAVLVPFSAGQTSVSFKVIPVDNGDVNANRVITFTLAESSSNAVTVGTILTAHAFTITDNETPSVITFASASSSVSEGDAEGIDISLALDPQTVGTGDITITIASDNAEYGTHYTTNPAATAGALTVPVGSGATTVSFKIIPADNNDIEANRVVNFTLGAATGIVVAGVVNNTHQVTITEDDVITTIADVRAMYTGSNVNINSSLRIQGVVTSINDNVNANNIWVQDATGGIVVRFVNPNNNLIARGDEIIVQLNGGQLTEFSGLRQVQNVANANASKVDDGVLPVPEVITISQFLSGTYEGRLVRLNNVGFVDADGVNTMGGTRVISDGVNSTNVRTENQATLASFRNEIIPYGIGTITGLAGENGGAVQIIPQVFADDVFASNPAGTLNVTQSLVDFGSVDNGNESTSQSYTVQGSALVADVVITASSGFKVSTDDATFSSSVTIPAANANSLNTIYVRFVPTTGVNQAVEGFISHKVLGAAPEKFDVSGTESGNAASTLLLSENFDYLLGTFLTDNGWTAHSGANTAPISVVSPGLEFSEYIGSGIGLAAGVNNNGEDIHRTFTTQTDGVVYASFLINTQSTNSAGYFLHFGPASIGTTFFSRVWVNATGTGVGIGASAPTSYVTITSETTTLLVLKYDFATKVSSLYVFNSLPTSEPAEADATFTETANLTNLGSIALRQYNASQKIVVDGIRVALNWNDLFN
jgi:hypothetical protein